MRTIIRIDNKEIKNRIRSRLAEIKSGDGLVATQGKILKGISGLRDGMQIGTMIYGTSETRSAYSLTAYESGGSMQSIHGHGKYALHIRKTEERGTLYIAEQIATGKWLLEAGQITTAEATREYGYTA